MSSQKRLILFLVLSISMMAGLQVLMDKMGWNPPPPKPVPPTSPPVVAAKAEVKGPVAAKDDTKAPAAELSKPDKPAGFNPPIAKASDLAIGSTASADPAAYRLQVKFEQRGAGVRELLSARFDGETAEGNPDPKSDLRFLREPTTAVPSSFAIALRIGGENGLPLVETPLDLKLWEVVRDKPDAPAVRTVEKPGAGSGTKVEGQEIAFRQVVDDLGLTVTKRFRIWKGEDGFEFDLAFEGKKDVRVSYRLIGPHGIPIEGEWFTSNFRDVFFGQTDGRTTTVITKSATDVYKARAEPEVISSKPMKFLGVENQYFAVFMQPWPLPTSLDDRRDKESMAFLAKEDAAKSQKSDVGVELTSLPMAIGPNLGVTHSYRVFAGPKVAVALAPYQAEELAGYRKWQLITIPFASELAKYVISPLLDRIYSLTEQVARMFGGTKGNYGIAIILLTMTVRLIMFPLSRKQALIAKKMQDFQPQLMAIKEKYKDDKDSQTRETLAFYKKTGFNPAAGCLPALIQMPIFVGLWQTLNNSVALRHSTFLYIRNLAAPDMLFKFPGAVPLIGDYFNLLPLVVVSLMLVQTKLFTPPPTTDEARMQQSTMKYMMIMMAFMFYWVPSGLGIYFITSSSWQICERLILPRLAAKKQAEAKAAELAAFELGTPPPTAPPAKSNNPLTGGGGWFAKKLEKLLEEAEKQKTIRNNGSGNGSSGGFSSDASRSTERKTNRPKPPGGGGRRS